ncbi:LysM domain-containing protein [Lentzea albidocapillata subsp. violacea]|uniref:LysM domain-containing protein n=1 Tax=Lentzea albidocapillata subsp. violacea TaxID=128104 RepID=A0A1G8V672_9PSEU|nr:Gmad2 immunoglobulin-like domain-containing protein [Lentzea albidocapillata]SDJ61354.1 LysM domain-containing protein [Lentzea albidocapillata subsp. violacea]
MSIDIQQPRPQGLVGSLVHIAGTAGGAFEAQFNYRIHEGHDEVVGAFMAGDGIGGHGQFQVQADVSGASFALDRLFVEVFWVSPKDGAELDKIIVPVVYGPLIVPGYRVYQEYEIKPGDTLWGIATQFYGAGNLYPRLVRANPDVITDPNVITPGTVIRIPQS